MYQALVQTVESARNLPVEQTVSGRPVCCCFQGYVGDPFYNCKQIECIYNFQCSSHLACRKDICVDPCLDFCGANAQCETRNHVPICSCPAGYTGEPSNNCTKFDQEKLCDPNQCGPNSQCEVVNNIPTCKCLPGYQGSPIMGCRHECENNAECGSIEMACIEFKCQNSCSQCGVNAECDIDQNNVPVCKCPTGYFGNATTTCQPGCTQHSDCPPEKPACSNNSCQNFCDGFCGYGANCELKNDTKPVCSCPKNMTGNPLVMCKPTIKADSCGSVNLCGPNAKCELIDGDAKCKCLPGYHGTPAYGCQRECKNNTECDLQLACIEFRCQNPCSQCGLNAECNFDEDHVPVCKCLRGYFGNASTSCEPGCRQHSDCPSEKPTCINNSCSDPCDGFCGYAANCELKNGINPICSCASHMTGDPLVMCKSSHMKDDACGIPNLCGPNADCKLINSVAKCECLPGYHGSPACGCQRECKNNSECDPQLYLINFGCHYRG